VTIVGSSRSPSSTESSALVCRAVAGPQELAEQFRIRHVVFVDEQGIFAGSDRDEHDDGASTIHVLGLVDGAAAGTVRLYPTGGTLWRGDRLAVLPEFRHAGLGAPLVRFAVATAARLGGSRMYAQIQLANTRFFRALGWYPVGEPADYVGVVHQQMAIELTGRRAVSDVGS
jgi:putative N-acetyltransferase (TIGR04045 family)